MAQRPRTIYLVKRLETLIRVRLETALQDLALTPGQYTTLSVIKVGPLSSADLARRVGITPQSMSEVIASLERKQLVVRQTRGDNRRIADLALTAAGETLLSAADQRVDVLEAVLMDSLSAQDGAVFRSMLERVLGAS